MPLFGLLAHRPTLRDAYARDVARALARDMPIDLLTEADLAPLPQPVQRYLRSTGAVGQPRVHNFRARIRGRFRNGRDARWMPCVAEQYNFIDEPARLFYMTASMFGIPVHGYHRYVGPSANGRRRSARIARSAIRASRGAAKHGGMSPAATMRTSSSR